MIVAIPLICIGLCDTFGYDRNSATVVTEGGLECDDANYSITVFEGSSTCCSFVCGSGMRRNYNFIFYYSAVLQNNFLGVDDFRLFCGIYRGKNGCK